MLCNIKEKVLNSKDELLGLLNIDRKNNVYSDIVDLKDSVKELKPSSLIADTKNLYNVDDTSRNLLVKGVDIQVNNDCDSTGYIAVTPNTTYCASYVKTSKFIMEQFGNITYVNYYDADKNLSNYESAKFTFFVTPNDCFYVRICSNNKAKFESCLMITQGGRIPYEYIPYKKFNEEYIIDSNFSKLPFFNNGRIKFILHRGLSANYPENTIVSFEEAGKAKAWAIETDVYETTDGNFVCIHDDTLDRTTNGSGNVIDYSLAELRALTITGGANIDKYPNLKIPTFEEYLGICKAYGCVAFIEIKTINSYANLIKIISDYGMINDTVLLCSEYLVPIIRDIDTNIPIAILYYSGTNYQLIADVKSTRKNVIINYQNANTLNHNCCVSIHNNNSKVGVWTIDDVQTAKSMFAIGVDVITTNVLTSLN